MVCWFFSPYTNKNCAEVHNLRKNYFQIMVNIYLTLKSVLKLCR